MCEGIVGFKKGSDIGILPNSFHFWYSKHTPVHNDDRCTVPVFYREISLVNGKGIHRFIGSGGGAVQQKVLDG